MTDKESILKEIGKDNKTKNEEVCRWFVKIHNKDKEEVLFGTKEEVVEIVDKCLTDGVGILIVPCESQI